MKRIIPLLIAIASTAAIASPTFAQTLQRSPSTVSAALAESQAEQAALDGDWSSSAALTAKSYRESPSLTNEFNLAADYARSGQIALAIPLYADVAANGRFSEGTALYAYRSGQRTDRAHFNYTDEANRRLAELTGG